VTPKLTDIDTGLRALEGIMKAAAFLILCMALPSFAIAQSIEDPRHAIENMHWMTEQYPPFNYVDEKDGKLKGITVDILMEMFKKVGVDKGRKEIAVLPWARGYRHLLDTPGSALFSTTYTVERLQHFKFVGPIMPTRVSIISGKDKSLKIDSVADMDRLTIGVVREDIGDQLIRALGVDDRAIKLNNSALSMVQMLSKGRLDAIAYAEDVAKYQLRIAGHDPRDYETVYVLQKSHMGYTFHKSTDPRVLEPLRKALDELRANGTVERIYHDYLSPEVK